MITIKCPLCKIDDTKNLYFKDGFKIVRCNKCGLIYVNPRLLKKELIEYYSSREYFICSKRERNDRYLDYVKYHSTGKAKNKFPKLITKIEKYKTKGRLLDIGCAVGFLVRISQEKGWESFGIDLSEWAIKYAREKLELKNVQQGDLGDIKFESNFFDVVVMVDVLEHVQDPAEDIKEVQRILKPGGLLYIETINFGNFITKYLIRDKFVHMVPTGHLTYFEKKHLMEILKSLGFRVLKARLWSSSIGDNDSGFFKNIIQYLCHIIKSIFYNKKQYGNLAFKDVIEVFAIKI